MSDVKVSSKPIVKAVVLIKVGEKTMCWLLPKADFNLRGETTFDGVSNKTKTSLRISGNATDVKNFSVDAEGF